ncbi:MAG: tyrosine-type recombinase/integrase, partial [Actinobacteria bacterium]|nr:tyrosine-type recombinase/integrase [Actinomycetota bacterium]
CRCRHNHDLRHIHATILLRDATTVKVVSERLGHANPAFTMSVYQHVLPGMQAEAAGGLTAARLAWCNDGIAPREAAPAIARRRR